jgi:CheY-like chemotaxis protein
MVRWIGDHFPGSLCHTVDDVDFKADVVLSMRPDVMFIDAALTRDEEQYFDAVDSEESTFDATKPISGIEYCRKVKANFPNLSVILTSKYFDARILAAAVEAGADGFLFKRQLEEAHFVPALRAAFYRGKTDDVPLYEKLRELLDDERGQAWRRDHMLRAVDAFFTRGSGSRRLTGLWCSLAELVGQVLPNRIVNELLRALMDTDALLLAANPRIRDHVRHAGNVFWLGYYLLNALPRLREPGSLAGYEAQAYDGSPLGHFDQLNVVWILASLLHDIGYVRERMGNIDARVERGRSLFATTTPSTAKRAKRDSPPPPEGLDSLQPYLAKLGPHGCRLYSAIATTKSRWGSPVDAVRKVEDHGLASASAFLAALKRSADAAVGRPEILHAAAAIALHNLAKWNKYWCESGGPVPLAVGLLPCAWLLGYCDELQGWGREPEVDPFDVEPADDVSKARKKYAEGYVKGSRIASFRMTDRSGVCLESRLEISIQYMLVHGDNAKGVSEDIRDAVQAWQTERAAILRETLGLDSVVETTITHWIPGPVTEPIEIKLDGRAGL